MTELALVLLTGVAAGVLNSVGGGGTFVALPALVAVGLPRCRPSRSVGIPPRVPSTHNRMLHRCDQDALSEQAPRCPPSAPSEAQLPGALHSRALRVRRPIDRSTAPPTAHCPNAGCSSSGHRTPPRPPTTGSRRCPPTPCCASWCEPPKSDGELSTTTASSRTALAWTTSRAATASAGTVTSPSSPSPRPSAPSCDSTPKPLCRRDPLRGPSRTPSPPGHLDRRLLDMRPTRNNARTTPQDLTKPY
ncbi:hypothetical protein ABID95_002138 [Streptomyces atratus]